MTLKSKSEVSQVLEPLLFIIHLTFLLWLPDTVLNLIHLQMTPSYRHCVPACATATVSELSNCIIDLSDWMMSHRLKVNQYKTEFLWLGTVGQLVKLWDSRPVLVLSDCVIRASDKARSLGVIIDSELSMKHQAQMVSRSCFFQLRQLCSISHFVDQYTAAALIHAFITGRLDYCNGLLAGAPNGAASD